MARELRKTGIEIVGGVPWGAHFCYFYETKQDLLDILIPYFKTGLENKEFCLWVISNSELLTVEEATSALRNALPDLDRYVDERSIEVVGHDEWFLSGKTFDPQKVANRFKKKLNEALARGYAGMRVNGSPAWLRDAGQKELRKFEAELDKLFPNERTIASCTYPLAAISGEEIFDVVRTHQFAIARRQGEWEIIETPELIQAKAEINRLNEELEQRVIERTGELAAANEELRREIAERRRVEQELRERAADLVEAQRVAKIGNWILNVRTNKVTWSDELYRIFEIENLDFDGRYESFVSRVHPDDQARVLRTNAQTRIEGSPFDIEYRIITPNDQTRIIREVGYATRDEAGQVIRLFGTAQDITEHKHAEEALRNAERKYRDIYENAVEGIFQTKPSGGYISANPALARMLGFNSPEELIRERSDPSKQQYVDRSRHDEFFRRLTEEGVVRDFEYEDYRKDGSTIWLSDNVRAVRDSEGNLLYYEGTTQDVTARKLAEQALRESEERYRELFENAKDGIYVHDLNGKYISVNRAGEKLTGYSRAEILGKSFTNFVPPEEVEKIREQLCRKLIDEGETTYEAEVITKDKRRVAVEVSSHMIYENGAAVAVQGTVRDITERRAAEEKVRASSEQLRALSARLQSAREEEGTRIAREIHDELGSALTGLKWDLEEIDKLLSTPFGPASIAATREKLQTPIKLADLAIMAVRRIASELRPSVLDDLGLVAAIEWQAQQFQARTGIVSVCDCSLEKVELTEEQSTAVFRIFQEALTNILRHAQATRVDIKIKKDDNYFVLSISDNGKGITEQEKSEQQSLGILGMTERAHLIGAEIDIEGVEGKGTVVTVRIPISGHDRVLKMTR